MEKIICTGIASDGNPCVLRAHANYHPTIHVSQEQLDRGREHGNDVTRPFTLRVGKAEKFPGTSWDQFDMCAVQLRFTDGDSIGQRVCAWIRPEDVWRFKEILQIDNELNT